MKYNFNEIEAKWQKFWAENQTFKADNTSDKPKYYVLDMFPYPSGAGLHVGHPLGYIASDIYARYKRHKGFNVLHPMGYDSFGLPAEQYAIQTGQHPDKTTKENIARYREQLDKIGFSFDWSREVRTSNPEYYKWTQWIFIQLFNSWYNKDTDKAENISTLVSKFKTEGNTTVNAVCDDDVVAFSAIEWNAFSEEEQQKILLQYRLTYLAETEVNWCPQLGTVLANDEIVNGVSERGGYPVVRKKMKQWSMRISAYAERLLQGLEKIDWPEPLKEIQRNWIGKSVGATVRFKVQGLKSKEENDSTLNVKPETLNSKNFIEVFTTRPDTIFGVSFMTLAPEHELVEKITTPEQKSEVEAYVEATSKRSERERMADVKTISGVFTGAYAEHPFTKEPIPIWIGDYVLTGYGTGAVMAVPCGDQRDFDFAKHFNIPIPNIFESTTTPPLEGLGEDSAFAEKEGFVLKNSDFLNGLNYKQATKKVIDELEKIGQGNGKINYRLRDAVFSRQRYWGEPFPVYYVNGLPQMIDTEHLPIRLPEVEKYLPTETGEPPLGNATEWAWDTVNNKIVSNSLCHAEPVEASHKGIYPLELNTMPGWAGSSWYFNRYMDAGNTSEFASQKALNYWKDVDLYIGGSEHATGHLLYARFWQKFLFDQGLLPVDEFAKKLINQGMILGESAFIHRVLCKYSQHNKLERKVNEAPIPCLVSSNLVKEINKLINSLSNDNKLSQEIKQNIAVGSGYVSGLVYVHDYLKNDDNQFENDFTILKSILSEDDIEIININYKIYERVKERLLKSNQGLALIINSIGFYNIHVDVSLVDISNNLDIEKFRKHPLYEEYSDAEFVLDNGEISSVSSPSGRLGGAYIVGREVEKMSKSKYNVVNPDDICTDYGADTLRMYEMFLGPLEQAKPWNTAGITGVHNFLKKLWKLYVDDNGLKVTDAEPSKDNLKSLHKTIKKAEEDIENFSFNTTVSTFMICVNELTAQKCISRAILEPLAVLISPYAPHIAEELWHQLGNKESIATALFPVFDEKHLVESTKTYPISFNGKMRFKLDLPLDMSKDEIEKVVMAHEKTQQQLDGRTPKKIIVVPGKIVNIVG
ncbi:class I tRNA ligase family protein [Galbibacter sp. EGI 63066]|uniref:leucine--tRNA ligase n=1 Tax=Galbibacter sp. EGI 63066 TaxID=2993559 RepID=UPI002249794D|nr:class I tRNA ligase family protein [Galbibacter sp. EGI 63066]MCX2678833.1 class I tRNA ligase family protein [Galbibacter sp. EGI 63066]